jgi:hypothetical protein
VRKEVNDYITGEKERTQAKAQQLLKGNISLTSFFMYLKTRVEAWHEVAGSIAYGGKAQLDPERNKRIQARINSELTYLREFQKQVRASFEAARKIASKVADSVEAHPLKSFTGKLTVSMRAKIEKKVFTELIEANPSEAETVTRKAVNEVLEGIEARLIAESISIAAEDAADLIGATITTRAGMYADAAYSTYQNNEAAREFDSGVRLGRRISEDDTGTCDECAEAADTYFVPLDELPEIGSLQCGSRCRCYFEYAEPDALTLDAQPLIDRLSAEVQ